MYDKSPSGQWSQNLAPSSMPKRLRPSFRSSPFLSAVETIVSMLSEALLSFGDISATFGLILQKGSRHTSHGMRQAMPYHQYVVLLFGMFLGKEITIYDSAEK